MPVIQRLHIGSPIAASTSGSVLYADANLQLAQDNSNLKWDATNHRLGIGVSPSTTLHVSATIGGSVIHTIENLDAGSSSDARIFMKNDSGLGGQFVTNSSTNTTNGGANSLNIMG